MRVFVLLALALSLASGQNKRMGTAGATELLIPVGARDLALGGSMIATSTGTEAIFWNPAGLSHLGHSAEAMFSTMSYIADIKVNYGAIGASFADFGVLAFTIKAIDFGDIPLTTNNDPEGRSGRLFSPNYVTIGLTYSRALTNAVSAGATLKVVTEHVDRVFASGIAIDVGVQYRSLGGIPGLNFGVTVKNIGPQMNFSGTGLLGPARRSDGERPEQKYEIPAASFELPSLFDLGVGYESQFGEEIVWILNGSFTNRNLGLDEFRVGGEVGYKIDESVQTFGRVGTGIVPAASKDEQNIFGLSAGLGIIYKATDVSITLDFAYRSAEFFDSNSVMSLKFGF